MIKRLFLSLPVPAKIAAPLARTLHHFENEEAVLRWTPVENLHATLFFFGNVEEEKIALLRDAIREIILETPPLELAYECITFALPGRVPRMIWAEFVSTPEYARLVEAIASIGGELLGLDPSKKDIIPHVTLGRIKYPERISVDDINQVTGLEEAVGIRKEELRPFSITYCELLESKLAPQGPTYSLIERFQFS